MTPDTQAALLTALSSLTKYVGLLEGGAPQSELNEARTHLGFSFASLHGQALEDSTLDPNFVAALMRIISEPEQDS